MSRSDRKAAIAAALILIGFGLGAYFLPTVMLAAGNISTAVAAVIGIGFVAAFFLIFWLRGRRQGRS